jgi:hypothetical protein
MAIGQKRDGFPLSDRKRRMLSLFIALNVAATCLWAAPIHAPMVSKLIGRAGLYLRWSGLGMGWAFFAPNPWNKNVFLTAELTYADGRQKTWKFPMPEDYGYFHRYLMSRSFMWAYETLPMDENAPLWPDAARYVARVNNDSDSSPATVKLTRHWAFIPDPGSNRQETWNEFDFFTYKVEARDLQ